MEMIKTTYKLVNDIYTITDHYKETVTKEFFKRWKEDKMCTLLGGKEYTQGGKNYSISPDKSIKIVTEFI